MLVSDAPQRTRSQDRSEALIREARRRQRRRWALIVAVLLAFSGLTVAVVARDGGSPMRGRRVRPTPSTLAPATLPAPLDGLKYPSKLAVANDGSLLIADQGTYQIKRRQPDGALSIVAGTGTPGCSGDGGPATSAELGWAADMAVAFDGTIYFTDFVGDVSMSHLRAIHPDGTITTVSMVTGGRGVTIAPDDRVWTAALSGIYRITPDGTSELVVPAGPFGLHLHSGDAYAMPRDLAFDAGGNLYVSNDSPPLLVELSPTFEVEGTWEGGRTYGGIIGTSTGAFFDMFGNIVNQVDRGTLMLRVDLSKLGHIPPVRTSGLARGPGGELYVDQSGAPGNGWSEISRLLKIRPDGRVEQLGTHPA